MKQTVFVYLSKCAYIVTRVWKAFGSKGLLQENEKIQKRKRIQRNIGGHKKTISEKRKNKGKKHECDRMIKRK